MSKLTREERKRYRKLQKQRHAARTREQREEQDERQAVLDSFGGTPVRRREPPRVRHRSGKR